MHIKVYRCHNAETIAIYDRYSFPLPRGWSGDVSLYFKHVTYKREKQAYLGSQDHQ